jgi:hypothetical protein
MDVGKVATSRLVCRFVCRTEVRTARWAASSRLPPVPTTTTATPSPCSHTPLPLCYPLIFLFIWAALFALIFCCPLLTTPLRATGRVVWLPRWNVFVPPLPSCLPVFFHCFRTAPFTSNLGALPGWLGEGPRVFLVALMIRLTCVVDFRWSTSLHFRSQRCVYLSE